MNWLQWQTARHSARPHNGDTVTKQQVGLFPLSLAVPLLLLTGGFPYRIAKIDRAQFSGLDRELEPAVSTASTQTLRWGYHRRAIANPPKSTCEREGTDEEEGHIPERRVCLRLSVPTNVPRSRGKKKKKKKKKWICLHVLIGLDAGGLHVLEGADCPVDVSDAAVTPDHRHPHLQIRRVIRPRSLEPGEDADRPVELSKLGTGLQT